MAAPSTATTTSTVTATHTAYGARMSTGAYRAGRRFAADAADGGQHQRVISAPSAVMSTPERQPVGEAQPVQRPQQQHRPRRVAARGDRMGGRVRDEVRR